ncbi:hypothetical protein B0H16DRAFT_1704383 [Mycena metata]|uniref:Uncharacterized protein n=1 Tax=Mycena metata TaxID=1033252 RepID=A0AAD7GWH0_9AGAR|nr:hypothetical protein B0H16DRAFT_1704383 [Mycena metata]
MSLLKQASKLLPQGIAREGSVEYGYGLERSYRHARTTRRIELGQGMSIGKYRSLYISDFACESALVGLRSSWGEAVESFGSQAGRARAVFKDLEGRRVAKVPETLIVHEESQDGQEYRRRTRTKGKIRVGRDTIHAKMAKRLEVQGNQGDNLIWIEPRDSQFSNNHDPAEATKFNADGPIKPMRHLLKDDISSLGHDFLRVWSLLNRSLRTVQRYGEVIRPEEELTPLLGGGWIIIKRRGPVSKERAQAEIKQTQREVHVGAIHEDPEFRAGSGLQRRIRRHHRFPRKNSESATSKDRGGAEQHGTEEPENSGQIEGGDAQTGGAQCSGSPDYCAAYLAAQGGRSMLTARTPKFRQERRMNPNGLKKIGVGHRGGKDSKGVPSAFSSAVLLAPLGAHSGINEEVGGGWGSHTVVIRVASANGSRFQASQFQSVAKRLCRQAFVRGVKLQDTARDVRISEDRKRQISRVDTKETQRPDTSFSTGFLVLPTAGYRRESIVSVELSVDGGGAFHAELFLCHTQISSTAQFSLGLVSTSNAFQPRRALRKYANRNAPEIAVRSRAVIASVSACQTPCAFHTTRQSNPARPVSLLPRDSAAAPDCNLHVLRFSARSRIRPPSLRCNDFLAACTSSSRFSVCVRERWVYIGLSSRSGALQEPHTRISGSPGSASVTESLAETSIWILESTSIFASLSPRAVTRLQALIYQNLPPLCPSFSPPCAPPSEAPTPGRTGGICQFHADTCGNNNTTHHSPCHTRAKRRIRTTTRLNDAARRGTHGRLRRALVLYCREELVVGASGCRPPRSAQSTRLHPASGRIGHRGRNSEGAAVRGFCLAFKEDYCVCVFPQRNATNFRTIRETTGHNSLGRSSRDATEPGVEGQCTITNRNDSGTRV